MTVWLMAGWNDYDGDFSLSTDRTDFFLRFAKYDNAVAAARSLYEQLPSLRLQWGKPKDSGSKDFIVISGDGEKTTFIPEEP